MKWGSRAFHPSNVKIYLYLVDSENGYMLSENKDVVQSLKEHSLCFLLYLNKFQRLNSINLNFYGACGSVLKKLSIKGLRTPRKQWYKLPAGLRGPAINAVSRKKLWAIFRLGIQEARELILLTSGEL